MFRQVQIAGIPFPVINYKDSIEVFRGWIKSRSANQVCIVNVHTLVTTMRDSQLRNIMQNAGMNTMDGQPLRWYSNIVCKANVKERVCGPELMRRCIEHGVDEKWRHYLLGGHPDVLKNLENRLNERYPGVQIAGCYSPPFRSTTDDEEAEIIVRINESDADFLWVGLGAPRQEKWINQNLDQLNVPICVGVGAAFDFHAGSISRAPVWIQVLGFEWLYRACNDPRLFVRYFNTNPPFLWMFARDYVRIRLLGRQNNCEKQTSNIDQ